MKHCAKCGKELLDEAVICPGCGCAVEGGHAAQRGKTEDAMAGYEKAARGAGITNIIGFLLLAAGVVCGVVLYAAVGSALCLIAEIIALLANTKVKKLFKSNNASITDKKAYQAAEKQLLKELKAKYFAFKLSIVLAVVALVGVIGFALLI